MKSDQKVVVDCSVTRATPRRLCDVSSDREDSVFIANEPPDSIASLKKEIVGILRQVKGYWFLLGLEQTARP